MSLNSTPQISTTVGDEELLTSGFVHLEGDKTVTVQIDNLKFVFSFKADDEGSRYVGTVKDSEIHFELFNHKNPLGEGRLTPVKVGKLNDRSLSFTYFVNTISAKSNSRRFEYAFYVGESK